MYWTDPDFPSVTTTTTNVVGWTVESTDEDWNPVRYDYNADGSLKWAQIDSDSDTKIRVYYDNAGNRISLIDPNYGETESRYNAYGQLVWTQTPKGNYTDYEYDNLGRVTKRLEHDVEMNKTDSTLLGYLEYPGKLGLLDYISFNGKRQHINYTYDNLNRVSNVSETRLDNSYYVSYTYDYASRVSSVTYPTGFQMNKEYTTTGHLSSLTDSHGFPLWTTLRKNAAGQIESYMTGDSLVTKRTYNPENARLTEILTKHDNDTLQYYTYNYDIIANLAARTDHVHNMREEFVYDKLNRLTGIVEDGDTTACFDYDAYGRMLRKYMHSVLVFDSAAYNADDRPHAIVQAQTPLDLPLHRMRYTYFDKLAFLTQDTLMVDYYYGYEHQRLHMTEANTHGDTLKQKEYVGNCEYIDNGMYTTTLTYLSGPLGVFGVQEKRDGYRPDRYFIHPDHLGSWTLLTDSYANIRQDVMYDAWGTPYGFDETDTTALVPVQLLLFDRGFTGHEHLLQFGLINMNGRMYDPFTSGFLSVDNYVQSPDYTQSFNRYAYCLNNPLKYTDPDGEFFILDAWLSGFFQGFFSTDQNRLSNGWKRANQLAKNDAKILGGLIRPDFNKGFFGRNWDVFSRLTWEFPQTKVGLTFALFSNLCGQVDNVEYYDGVTVSSGNNFGIGGAVTLGNYINGSSNLSASPDNYLFQHEYGHYLQSKATGPLYLSRYAIPSGLNCLGNKNPDFHPVEQDANIRAFKYFNNKIDGFSDWNFDRNPIVGYLKDLPITNENNQAALKNGRLQPAWYDYVFALSPTVGGLTIPAADGLINPRVDGLINPMAGGVLKMITAGLFNWWMLEDYEEP